MMTKRNLITAFAIFILCDLIIACVLLYHYAPPPSLSKPKHIILVTIDTLRADHLSVYGYPRNTSPFIDSLAKTGTVFLNAFTAAPHTAPSHATMFTSLFPFQHNLLRNQETLNSDIFNLKMLNDENGIKSEAFPAVKFMEGKVGFPFSNGITNKNDKSFKKFWYRNATNVVDNAISWLESTQKEESTFTWIHFYDVHEWSKKKNIPPVYFEKVREFPQAEHLDFLEKNHNLSIPFFGSEDHALRAINGYDARVMYVDDELKRLNTFLENRDFIKDTLWIITSDHGEGLGNHNYKGHGEYLYQEQLHIPLIFNQSGATKHQHVRELARTVDIFPTIAEFIGAPISREKHSIEGNSLYGAITGNISDTSQAKFSFAERRPKDMISFRREWEEGEIYSLHDLTGKYIEHSDGVDEFYDLKNDPFEKNNIEKKTSIQKDELKSEISKIFDNSKRSKNSNENTNQTPEELEELKSLGYL